jgi:hypothetical protein
MVVVPSAEESLLDVVSFRKNPPGALNPVEMAAEP